MRSIIHSIFLTCFISAGQIPSTIDSLETALNTMVPNTTGEVDILNQLGYQYWVVNSNTSLEFGNLALEKAKLLSYKEGMALAHRIIGVSHWTLGSPKKALENLTSSQRLYAKVKDEEGVANSLMNTGMVYADIGDLEKALGIYHESIEKFTALDLNRRIATTFTKIGDALIQKNNLEEAKGYLANALNMHSAENYVYGMAEAHNRLGKLALNQMELELADYHIKKAMELSYTINDEDGRLSNLIQTGKLFRIKKEFELANAHLVAALKKAKAKKLRKYVLEVYQELGMLKRDEGKFDESLQFYDTYNALKDSIYDINKSKQIAALEFENELKDRESKIKLLEQEEKTNNVIKWALGMGIVALGIIAYLMLRIQNQRSKKDQEIIKSREQLAKIDLENAHLKQLELQNQLVHKNKELASYALNFSQKNQLFSQLLKEIKEIKEVTAPQQQKQLMALRKTVAQHISIDRDWEDFRRYFEEVHIDFFKKLKEAHPDISSNDLKICALVRLNLNIKETANILGISPESAKTARYRLRKKLGLGPEQDLLDFLLNMENESKG